MNTSELRNAIQETFPRARVEKEELDSGVVWINIWLGQTFVSVECSPSRGFGVSRVSDGDPGFSGHEHVFATSWEVLEHVRQLLSAED